MKVLVQKSHLVMDTVIIDMCQKEEDILPINKNW